MLKHYIEFLYPGSFFAESYAQPVEDRSAPKDIPERATGYRLFSQGEVELDGEVVE